MASIKDIYDALKVPTDNLASFRAEWQALAESDKEDLKRWTDEKLYGRGVVPGKEVTPMPLA